MSKCIICGKEHQDSKKYCLSGNEYNNICPSCYDKLNNFDNDKLSIWVQRMIEIDNITDEGMELLENVVAYRQHKIINFQKNAKWSNMFSLILTVIGIVTVAVGFGLGYLIFKFVEDEAIFIIIGGVVGIVAAIIEIAFGKVVAEIGENIAAIRSNLK